MRLAFRSLGALETRVGLQTFILFGLCAMVPIAIFAWWSYEVVSSELTESARTRLGEASKGYGILLNDRLRIVQSLLVERAQRQLRAAPADAQNSALFDSRVRLVDLRIEPEAPSSPESTAPPQHGQPVVPRLTLLSRSLEVVNSGTAPAVRIAVRIREGRKTVLAIGEPDAAFFWNRDAVELPESTVCVHADGAVPLYCSSEEDRPTTQTGRSAGTQLSAEWRLFLKPQYGASEWIITTAQAESVALQSLRAFQSTLPIAAGLALCIASLLSLVQIRRSHGPLRTLIDATRRLGRGRFGAPIKLSGRDEYAGLARAFNQLSGRLKRQFQLRAAFGEVDRSILLRSEIEPILETVLPRMREVLGCDRLAVLIVREHADGSQLMSVRSSEGRSCTTERVKVGPRCLEALTIRNGIDASALADAGLSKTRALNDSTCIAWHAAAIDVDQQVRGVVLLGFSPSRRIPKNTPRHTAELARRLAVALSHEDRDRALLRQAYSDALTGLANRQLFQDRLERELAHSKRFGTTGAVLFIDFDRFKNVNDSLGHSVGDDLLKLAALRLQALVRECDTLARIGGDEFTMICPRLDAHAAGALAARVLETLRAPEELRGMRCVIQASIGIACFPLDGDTVEALVRNADTAMYRAKFSGGGKAVFFEEAMNVAAVRRLRIEQRLRQALDARELTLHFQPKVDARGHELVGAEALARWCDPEEGSVPPIEFISIAEECGLITQLGEWALDATCRTLKGWRDRNLLIGHIAVNVSVRQLRDPGFPGFVQKCLERYGLPRGCLELEMTESTLIHDVEQVADVLRRIKALGVRVAIDDFGTGYSSLAVLQRLPVDILKIDRHFVSTCTHGSEGAAMFDTLTGIARALGKSTVAEGVETCIQADFASGHGCDVLQGYFFGYPLSTADFEHEWLAGERSDQSGARRERTAK